MIRNSVVLVALLCAGGAAFAQTAPGGQAADWQAKRQQWEQKWQQERAEMQRKRMDRLAVLLDMTPAQKKQVASIFSAERSKVRQAMKQAMDARRAARAETVTKLGQVLSPEQMKKLKLLLPERHRRFLVRRGPMGPMGMHGPMGMWGGWGPHPGHGEGPPPPQGPGPQ